MFRGNFEQRLENIKFIGKAENEIKEKVRKKLGKKVVKRIRKITPGFVSSSLTDK
jgi:hypothetical protein